MATFWAERRTDRIRPLADWNEEQQAGKETAADLILLQVSKPSEEAVTRVRGIVAAPRFEEGEGEPNGQSQVTRSNSRSSA